MRAGSGGMSGEREEECTGKGGEDRGIVVVGCGGREREREES